MSWSTSTDDLRRALSDGPTDRYRYRKAVFGETNSVNKRFKTFEFRRVTNFTTATAPQGVYKNAVLLTTADFTSDTVASGEFVLAVAPIDGDVLEASYYIQWFLDTELADFNLKAVQWLGLAGADVSVCPDGLIPAALNKSCAEAYRKMALRWREHLSEGFRLEDTPDKKGNGVVDDFLKLADSYEKLAKADRDDFYKRQGQSLAPLWGQSLGNVRDRTPKG